MDSNLKRSFDILEISSNSTYDDAKASYRLLAHVWHPDKHAHNDKIHAKATSKLKDINAAWSDVENYFKEAELRAQAQKRTHQEGPPRESEGYEHIRCRYCNTNNRIPIHKLVQNTKCGKCGVSLTNNKEKAEQEAEHRAAEERERVRKAERERQSRSQPNSEVVRCLSCGLNNKVPKGMYYHYTCADCDSYLHPLKYKLESEKKNTDKNNCANKYSGKEDVKENRQEYKRSYEVYDKTILVQKLMWTKTMDIAREHDAFTNTYTSFLGKVISNEMKISKSNVDPFILELNRIRYGGFNDWRIPSLQDISNTTNALIKIVKEDNPVKVIDDYNHKLIYTAAWFESIGDGDYWALDKGELVQSNLMGETFSHNMVFKTLDLLTPAIVWPVRYCN